MTFKFELFMNVLWLGVLCGIISTICLQKIKETKLISSKKLMSIISIFTNLLIGFFISKMFTNLDTAMCIEVGIITWIGAEAIYDKLRNKHIFKSTKEIIGLDKLNDKDIR